MLGCMWTWSAWHGLLCRMPFSAIATQVSCTLNCYAIFRSVVWRVVMQCICGHVVFSVRKYCSTCRCAVPCMNMPYTVWTSCAVYEHVVSYRIVCIWTCYALCEHVIPYLNLLCHMWPAERWVGPGGGERGEERGALLLLPGALPRHHLLLQAQAPPSLLRSVHFLPVFNREVNLFVSLSKATLRIFLRVHRGNEGCLLLLHE